MKREAKNVCDQELSSYGKKLREEYDVILSPLSRPNDTW